MVWSGEKYTGPDFEMDFFGTKINWPEIIKKKGLDRDNYMPYKRSMNFIRDNYPIEPYPYTKMSQDIFDQVAEELGFDPDPVDEKEFEKLKERLKFFDGLHTHLDDRHSVDGFIVYIDDEGIEKICTLDTSLNPKKGEEDVLADVWIGDAPDHRRDSKGYEEWYTRRAKQIAARLGKGAIRVSNKYNKESRPAAMQ
jgi:hypothetical protein